MANILLVVPPVEVAIELRSIIIRRNADVRMDTPEDTTILSNSGAASDASPSSQITVIA
jgi:hypothetical protein